MLAAPPLPDPSFNADAMLGAKLAVRDHGPMSEASRRAIDGHASREQIDALNSWQEKIWHPAPNRQWLGVYFETDSAIGDTDVLTMTKDGQTLYATEVSVAMRVKNRLLLLRCKNLKHDSADWRTPQEACRQWSEEIVRANMSRHEG